MTLAAFADHGRVERTLDRRLDEAEQAFADVAAAGAHRATTTSRTPLRPRGSDASSTSWTSTPGSTHGRRRLMPDPQDELDRFGAELDALAALLAAGSEHPMSLAVRPALERAGLAEQARAALIAVLRDANEDPSSFLVHSPYVVHKLRRSQ